MITESQPVGKVWLAGAIDRRVLAGADCSTDYGSFPSFRGRSSVTEEAQECLSACKAPGELPGMSARFGKLTNDDLDAYRFVCTQRL